MAWHETWLHADLAKPINVEHLRGVMFSQDNMANKVGVHVKYDGEDAALSGAVIGYVIRPDGQTVIWNGYLDAAHSEAYIVLPESAYAVVGQIQIAIRLVDGDTKTVLLACVAYVQRTSTDTYVDPGSVVPDITDLLAKIAACDAAATAANGATVAAYNAVATIENLQPNVYAEEISDGAYRLVIENATVSPGVNKPRKILLLGDSYATTWTTGFQFTPWPVTVKSYVEAADADSTVIYKGRSGCAFGVPTNSPYAFCNIFTAQTITGPDGQPMSDPGVDFGGVDPKDITDVYVFAGRNDFTNGLLNSQKSVVLNGIQAFVSACLAKCSPGKPRIYIGMIGGIGAGCYLITATQNNTTVGLQIVPPVENGATSSAAYAVGDYLAHNGVVYKAKTAIAIGDTFTVGTNIEDANIYDMKEIARLNTADWYGECVRYGAVSVPNCDSILRDTEYMYGDKIHPNAGGQNELARYIANVVLGEGIGISRQRTYSMDFTGTGFTLASGVYNVIDEVQVNQRVTVFSRSILPIEVSATNGITLTQGQRIKLFSIQNSCFCGDSFLVPAMAASVDFVDKDNNWSNCLNTIEYEDNTFYLRCNLLADTGYLASIANVKRMNMPRIYFTA